MTRAERILIVDDELLVATDLSLALQRFGFNAPCLAQSGEDAITRAEEEPFDLALVDVVLDGEMDGIATGGVLGNAFATSIVYLTAHSDEQTAERARQTEPAGFLTKPFNEHTLRIAVEAALRDKRQRAQRAVARDVTLLAERLCHELGTPLQVIQSQLQYLSAGMDAPDAELLASAPKALREALDAMARVSGVVAELRRLALS